MLSIQTPREYAVKQRMLAQAVSPSRVGSPSQHAALAANSSAIRLHARAPLAALQRRHLRRPRTLAMKLNAFQTVVSNPSWHIACTSGAPAATNHQRTNEREQWHEKVTNRSRIGA
jgi:hypothetical protein